MTTGLRATPVRPRAADARAIEIIEAESAFSQHGCAPPDEARRLGLVRLRFGSAALVLTRQSQNAMYNRAVALGQASPATEAQLDRILEAAREHRVASVSVSVGASARPERIVDWLEARDFIRGSPSGKLWRDGGPLAPDDTSDGVEVRLIGPDQAALWVDVVAPVWRTFGFRRPWFEARVATPGWRHYLAWVDGEPVGAGTLYVGPVGTRQVGHLVGGVTLPRWRRRGVQTALIRARISDGRALGCDLFTSETAPPLPRMPLVSFRNLCRQGFALAYLRQVWKHTF